ncbi:MAG: HU family DNA-binding protein [Bacteroidaceae bacterium]|nr:HU family DNA-binding protein [Bacteroidaceae bacterium]
MAKKTAKSAIKCRATSRHLLNGTQRGGVEGIRVTVSYSQKHTLADMAETINDKCTVNVADVYAVWNAMEGEIVRILSRGGRIELGSLGVLSLEIGTRELKSIDEGITNKDIVAKGVTFAPSKKLKQAMADFAFECDGLVTKPLDDGQMMRALEEYLGKKPCIIPRVFATLCHCSSSTAYRRIDELVADGVLRKSDIAPGSYEWADEEE